MRTSFAPHRLDDPDIREANGILRTCVHCGFCTATCPTYVLTGDERDSPRGRIVLIKEMLERDEPADATVTRHIDRCLGCLACTSTCPSGVDYMHLVDLARDRIERTYHRPAADRVRRWALAHVLPYQHLFRWAMGLGRLTRPVAGWLPAGLCAMIELLPAREPVPAAEAAPATVATPVLRVALAPACVQPALDPAIDAACRRLLARLGVQVVAVPGTGCCGALTHHMGRREDARAAARRNVAAFRPWLAAGRLDAIVVTASGCGTLLKDYGHLLADDPDFAHDARRLASLARDVTEVLDPLMRARTPPAGDHTGLSVAYHAACSLQHGQKIAGLPEALLRCAGFEVRPIGEGHLCCGSAGTYNLLQPAFATALRDRKARNIAATGAKALAAGNIGCLVQLRGVVGVPAVHTVELLDWAWGGPAPAAFARAVDHETV